MTVDQQVDAPALDSFKDGDRIEVSFDPPLKDPEFGHITSACGILQTLVSRYYLHSDDHRSGWGMAACFDLNGSNLQAATLVEHAFEINEQRRTKARGEIVFKTLPVDAQDVEEQLNALAEMIFVEKDTGFWGRKRQLMIQFDDIADLVSLAKTKRNYVLLRAIIGGNFHPYETRDDRVYRNTTVRPLPADFEPDRADRINRSARFDQAIRIFGEAERETRQIASAMRSLGYDVRRPHPNAQELIIRFKADRAYADVALAPSSNGLWESKERPPDNKTKARWARRLLKGDVMKAIAMDLAWVTSPDYSLPE